MQNHTRLASLCPEQTSRAFDKSLWTIRHHPDLTLATRAVHAALISLRNQGYLGRATQRDIAKWAGVGLRSVVRGLKQLTLAGLVIVKRLGQGNPNQYELVESGSAKRAESVAPNGRSRSSWETNAPKKDWKNGYSTTRNTPYRPPVDWTATRLGHVPPR